MKKGVFPAPTCPMEAGRKLRKKSGKSNITAERVTLLPGFLSRGIKSETVHKTAKEEPPGYAELLKENFLPPRRSSRLRKPPDYLQVVASSRTKSIFKEIKERYAEKVKKVPANHGFKAKLFEHLRPNFKLKDSLFYKNKIFKEVGIVNDILSGKLDSADMSINRKRQFEEDKENYPMKFPYVPQSKWVFQTPPNRKLHYPNSRVDDNCMKPAVVETCQDSRKVYEVNNKINVDFSRYTNHQEIDIDKRYLVEVDSAEDITVQFRETEDEDKQFHVVQSDPYELENHFLSLTCRPKKPTTISRVYTHKRKRDIFEPEAGCSTDFESANEFNSSFNFINNLQNSEESFTFKFTSNEGASGATTGHMFDFDGNQKDSFNFHF